MATPTGTFTTVLGIPVTTIEGTEGSDVLGGVKIRKNLRINAKDGNDNLTVASNSGGSLNAISVYGNAGNDRITLKSTTTGSLIQGGGGGDVIRVSSAATEVTVRGGSENDQISGLIGGTKLILNGNKGFDTLNIGGTFINSSIHGGDSDDIINIQSGILNATHIKGDKGNDTITDGGAAIDLTFRNGSKIYGNDGNDNIDLSSSTKSADIHGGAHNDTLVGGAAVDTIIGGAGDDVITGNGEEDFLRGGAGNDIFRYDNLASFVAGNENRDKEINGGDGSDTVEVAAALNLEQFDVMFGTKDVEILRQTATNASSSVVVTTNHFLVDFRIFDYSANAAVDAFNFTGITNAIDLELKTGGGNDTVTAGAGNDTVTAGAGNDSIEGGNGNDIYVGATAGQSVAATDVTNAGDTWAAGDIIEFDNSLDVITGFDNGTDKIRKAAGNTANVAALTNLEGDAIITEFNDTDGAYVLYGNFNAANGKFTITADFHATNSHDALFTFGEAGQTLIGQNATSWTLLLDIDDALAVGDAQQAA